LDWTISCLYAWLPACILHLFLGSTHQQEPESPLPPPFSFASYDVPEDLHLSESSLGPVVALGGNKLITRLVGSHPLWAHHLYVAFLGQADAM
jgi:hypothetical protein